MKTSLIAYSVIVLLMLICHSGLFKYCLLKVGMIKAGVEFAESGWMKETRSMIEMSRINETRRMNEMSRMNETKFE